MQSFKDCTGREWRIALTIGSLKRIKEAAGVDLLDLLHPERNQPFIDRITSDPLIVCEIIFAAVNPDITKEAFVETFDGDAVEAATEALLKAITDFCPSHRRPLMAKVLEKVTALQGKQAKAAMALLDDPKLDQAIDAILSSGPTSTASPASSASTPTLGACGS